MRPALVALAVSLLAAACGGPEPGNRVGNGAETAAAPAPAPIEASRLVGRWSESPDCASGFEFRADGSFTVAEGGEGRWVLDGDTLTLTGEAGSARVRLRQLDARAMVAEDEEGRTSRSVRC